MKEKKLKSRKQISVRVINPPSENQAQKIINELSLTIKKIYGGMDYEKK